MKHNISTILKAFYKRGIFALLIFSLVSTVVFKLPETIYSSQIKTLNRLKPSQKYLGRLAVGIGTLNHTELLKALYYFKKVTEYIPGRTDAYSMIAYIYYQFGEDQKAIEYYKKAIEGHPSIFWFHYNLGVIYLKNREYEKAKDSFEAAIKASKPDTIKYTHSSKVFRHIIRSSRYVDFGKPMAMRFERNIQKAFVGSLLCYEKLNLYADMIQTAIYGVRTNFEHDSLYFYYAGLGNYHLKNYNAALPILQQAIERNPNNTEAMRYYGMTLIALGKEKEGRQALKMAELNYRERGSFVDNFDDLDVIMF